MNSNAKGKRGEREAAKALRALGIDARRGQQYAGGQDSPDIVTDIPNLHIEVKRTEALNLYGALDQAIRDAQGKTPIVLHRRNNKDWVCIVRLGDIAEWLKTR